MLREGKKHRVLTCPEIKTNTTRQCDPTSDSKSSSPSKGRSMKGVDDDSKISDVSEDYDSKASSSADEKAYRK
jgi:hypothetical protein